MKTSLSTFALPVILFLTIRGFNCEYDLLKCECLNNGTCTYNPNNSSSLLCACSPGFSGDKCEIDTSVCSKQRNPCQNGGKCIGERIKNGSEMKYTCQCEPGWMGETCDVNIDDCISQPCQNGAVCLDEINDFSCACQFGFSGKVCETKLQVCEVNSCQNGGFCLIENGNSTCYCVPDFHGLNCELRYNECEPEPQCHNGGTCIDGVGGFNCSCPPGFFGATCNCTEDGVDQPWCNEPGLSVSSTLPKPTTMILPISTVIAPTSMVVSTLTPTVTFSVGLNSEVPFEPSPTPSMADSELEPSMLSTFNPSSLIVSSASTSFRLDSERQIPELTESPVNEISGPWPWPAQTAIPASPGLSSTMSISVTAILSQSELFQESHGMRTSLDFERSTRPSFESTKVYLTTESGIFQTVSPQPELSEFEPPISTVYMTMEFPLPSSQFPYQSQPISMGVPPPANESYSPQESDSDSKSRMSALYSAHPTPSNTNYIPEVSRDVQMSSEPLTFISNTLFQSGTQGPSSPLESQPPDNLISTSISKLPLPFPSTLVIEVSESPAEPSSLFLIPSDSGYLPQTLPGLSDSDLISPTHEDASKSTFQFQTEIPPDFSTAFPQTRSMLLSPSYPSESDTFLPSLEFPPTERLERSTDNMFTVTETIHKDTESPYFYQSSSDIDIDSSFEVISPTYRTTIQPIAPTASRSSLLESELLHSTSSVPSIQIVETIRQTPLASDTPTPPLGTIHFSTKIFATEYFPDISSSQLMPTTTEILATATPTIQLPTNLTDPCLNYCQNNGKCLSQSIEPPICLCPLKFKGDWCESSRDKVDVPSLNGNSFLSYELPTDSVSVLDISMKMATLVPEGIVMYTAASMGKFYAFIFVQAGLLSLHFSCGSQSMNFVETRTRVDNGFNFTVKFRMQLVPKTKNEIHCTGELKVNDSYTMMGEQLVGRENLFNTQNSTALLREIFVGGIPTKLSPSESKGDQLLAFLPGFRGCLYQLSISDEERDMFDDATAGRDISECGTLACIVNPCFGHSICVPAQGQPRWECICPPGFGGSRCQIPICRENPCRNGATCTATLTKVGGHNVTKYDNDTQSESSRCLCAIGFTGSLCEKSLKIEKPSFRPTTDYSSFVSYRQIPNIEEWFQMKFHFVTKNMSQLALLMYIGNKMQSDRIERSIQRRDAESVEEGLDFFALSFLQGFVALTWNLGTGVQRIVTPSRINPRLGIHTLFVGRNGKSAWIKVDGMRNTSGKTVGPLYRLNVNKELFIGGYESFQFEGLPHDLWVHTGFHGCVFDLGFRVENKLYLPNITSGRNVKNCFEEDC